jgi:hypothetical protein
VYMHVTTHFPLIATFFDILWLNPLTSGIYDHCLPCQYNWLLEHCFLHCGHKFTAWGWLHQCISVMHVSEPTELPDVLIQHLLAMHPSHECIDSMPLSACLPCQSCHENPLQVHMHYVLCNKIVLIHRNYNKIGL